MVEGYYCKATSSMRRKAARAFVQQWCQATLRGERDVFEAKWATPSPSDEASTKNRSAMAIDAPSAVAESMLIDAPSAVAEAMPIDALPAVAEFMPINAPPTVADVEHPSTSQDERGSGDECDADGEFGL